MSFVFCVLTEQPAKKSAAITVTDVFLLDGSGSAHCHRGAAGGHQVQWMFDDSS